MSKTLGPTEKKLANHGVLWEGAYGNVQAVQVSYDLYIWSAQP
jgi:hypothetical protein